MSNTTHAAHTAQTKHTTYTNHSNRVTPLFHHNSPKSRPLSSAARPLGDLTELGAVRSLLVVNERIWTVYANMTIAVSTWNNMPDGAGLPFTLKHHRTRDRKLPAAASFKALHNPATSGTGRTASASSADAGGRWDPVISGGRDGGGGPGTGCFEICGTGDRLRLLSCGYWDGKVVVLAPLSPPTALPTSNP